MPDASAAIAFLPERIAGLAAIATNLSWSWNWDARAVFRSIDQRLWHLTRHNPIELLQRVDAARLVKCAADPLFLKHYDAVHDTLLRLQGAQDTWFAARHPELGARPVAYFCAEFALHNSVPVYSGGLGVLAGDHCKAASDLGVPLVAVGLFYTKGYFDQHLRPDGWQEDADERINPSVTPLHPVLGKSGEAGIVTLKTSGRDVHIGAWRVPVGRVSVYLLDTNLDGNDPADRELTHKLYTGNPAMRLRQEWILGVGGVRVLRALGVDPAAWHANEGHAAFMLVERLRELIASGVGYDEARSRIRATSVFTTHTPVPAGHDMFPQEDVAQCAGALWEEMGISRETFLRLGHHPGRDHGLFHMTVAAIRLSARVNGVSARHATEARRIWKDLWPARDVAQVPIGHVTNGAHLGTWLAQPVSDALSAHLGPDWPEQLDDPGFADRILALDDTRLWAAHRHMRDVLHSFIREEARRRWRDQWTDPTSIAVAGTMLSPSAMTIGFARRFATYKRANLVFRDPERLRRLLCNPRRPVQIIFAGKAHPADEPGKKVLQTVYATAHDRHFEGRVAFLEDYELHLAHRLVQGVDLWLNLPRVPMEACGTSGMKAALNGVPQISTMDGWWAEGFTGRNGWSLSLPGPDEDVDAADADHLYGLLEEQVVPLFYERNDGDVPRAWVAVMKEALRTALTRFTARQMLQRYVADCYAPALRGELPRDDPPTA